MAGTIPWAPVELPRIRRRYAATNRDIVDGIDRSSVESADPRDRELFSGRAARATAAEMFWVTEPMGRVAMDASADMPEWTPAAVMPCPAGLLVWAAPLPEVPFNVSDRPVPGQVANVPVDGVAWGHDDGRLYVEVLTRTDRIRDRLGLGPSWFWYHSPLMAVLTLGPVPTEEPLFLDDLPAWRGLWAALGATWSLMQQPTVATPRKITGTGAGAGPRITREARAVTILELRRLEHRPADPDPDHPTRTYSHRWIVRGHWRQQAVGPNRSQRRPTWIASHTKGPEDKPLLTGDYVHVWRR